MTDLLHKVAKCQVKRLFLVLSVCFLFRQTAAFGQSITPTTDGTGTVVNPQGNRIDISGGQLSRDGVNLFHSFQQFGLTETQTANFLSNPAIQNILGRIVGGDASLINGLIQVTGGNSNLFLMNPAGIVFGPNAQLNVPASFTATTANSIGFGDRSFNAIGSSNYATLLGSPSNFNFSAIEPASIVNRGNLTVNPGGSLTLLGGTVINIGQISAPGGQINIVPVPGKSVVRISQPGHLLSLEVSGEIFNSETQLAKQQNEKLAANLPELLTGKGDIANATGLIINSDGSVQLTDSTMRSVSGIGLPENNHEALQIPINPLNMGNINLPHNVSNVGIARVVGDRIFVNPNINPLANSLPPNLAGGNTILTLNNLPPLGVPPQAALFNNINGNSNINKPTNFNISPLPILQNMQLFSAARIEGNPSLPKQGNTTISPLGLRGNLPSSKVNFSIRGANPPVNFASISNLNYLLSIEQNRADRYSAYFGESLTSQPMAAENIRETLGEISSQTGKRSAIIYVNLFSDRLELLLFTPDGSAIRKTVSEADRQTMLALAKEFRQEISNPQKRNTTTYKESARKLYDRLIAPLESDLQSQGINTLLFSLDTGLRSLPLAALYDGKQFLVEKYSLSQIPTISLTDTRYQSLQNASVLAMGAAQFTKLSPLPAVPLELATIAELWQGKSFLNEQFTLNNLKSQRSQRPYQIIHLATHGEFQPGAASDSFIQLWDSKLQLNQLRQLGWNNPPVELLVLSACRTALGDEETELGFAGLAFQAGVKSALASLWYVSDEGTLALMSEFYQQLKTAPIKAEALRQAQIAMLKGDVRIEQGVLRGLSAVSLAQGTRGGTPLPAELGNMGDRNLAHPYYWAAFTMIGSPW
ncbi:CHAT domain-containing protein [Tychonema sp. BBK16]|uniref:CHAT domain-containing protein n=1 Tax=Tychonema sp. BBK16 TaxID=2699888 RepID=UPI001F1B0EF9|nr:CHAT domain-containing protein [Tychonema sp. BBK16]MCF6375052.1 CHAT domain-containing protein [Tychonema sp. BBK16]